MKLKRTFMLVAAAMSAVFMFVGCDASVSLSSDTPSRSSETTTEATESVLPSETQTQGAVTDTPTEDTAETASTEVSDEGMNSDLPAPDPQYMTLAITGPITELDREQDIVYVSEQATTEGTAPDPANSVGAVEVDDCIVIDAQTGREVDDEMLQAGQEVTAYVGLAMSRSIPPQAACSAIITNLPTDGTSVAFVRAQEVTPDTDGVRVLNQNSDLYVTIPDDLTIEVFDETEQTVSADSIQPGSRMIVWYGMTTRSIPPQAVATKVVVDLDD